MADEASNSWSPRRDSASSPRAVAASAPVVQVPQQDHGFLAAKPFSTFPGVYVIVRPELVLRFRKYFYPLGLTKLSIGADFHAQKRQWSLKWSWKDRLLGGRLALNGSELSINREFRFDSRNCINVRAGVDIHSGKKLVGLDIRPFQGLSSRASPPGFDFRHRIPLDNRISLGAQGNIAVPEASYGLSDRGVSFGSGDFKVDINRLDLTFKLE